MPFVPLTEYLEIRWNILIKQEMNPMASGFVNEKRTRNRGL